MHYIDWLFDPPGPPPTLHPPTTIAAPKHNHFVKGYGRDYFGFWGNCRIGCFIGEGLFSGRV